MSLTERRTILFSLSQAVAENQRWAVDAFPQIVRRATGYSERWALQEQVATEVRALLPSGARDRQAPASSWLLAALSVQTLRQQVRGSWSEARIRACRSQLRRFLVPSRRKRRQKEADIRQWLEERFGSVQPLLEAA